MGIYTEVKEVGRTLYTYSSDDGASDVKLDPKGIGG